MYMLLKNKTKKGFKSRSEDIGKLIEDGRPAQQLFQPSPS